MAFEKFIDNFSSFFFFKCVVFTVTSRFVATVFSYALVLNTDGSIRTQSVVSLRTHKKVCFRVKYA